MLSDVESHEHAMSLPIGRVVRELVDLLGAGMVAAIGGVNETRAVTQWMADREPQRPQVLRLALQLANMIARQSDMAMARAWFQGSNPRLADRSPVMILREAPEEGARMRLVAAARAFASRGDS